MKLGSVPLDVVALFFTVNVYTDGKNFSDVKGECVTPPGSPTPSNHPDCIFICACIHIEHFTDTFALW